MTREEAIEVIKAYRDKLTNSVSNQLDGDIETFEMAIQALSQEPCDDAVSLEYLKNIAGAYGYVSAYDIATAPPVTQKSGKWIEELDDFGDVTKYHCSKCYEDTGFVTDCKWKFCPNCGARMAERSGE